MDHDLLVTFVAFAETQSFTAAGRKLGLSQPAVHAQVGRLAEHVGAALYQRVGRGVALTEVGQELAVFAREQVGRTETFLARARGTARPLVMAAGEGTWLYLLEDFLEWWQQRGEPLRPVTANAVRGLAALRAHEVDAVVTSLEAPPGDLEVHRWMEVGAAVLLQADDPLAEGASVTLAQLAERPMVVPSSNKPHRLALEQAMGGALQVAVEADGWELQRLFVAAGFGPSGRQ